MWKARCIVAEQNRELLAWAPCLVCRRYSGSHVRKIDTQRSLSRIELRVRGISETLREVDTAKIGVRKCTCTKAMRVDYVEFLILRAKHHPRDCKRDPFPVGKESCLCGGRKTAAGPDRTIIRAIREAAVVSERYVGSDEPVSHNAQVVRIVDKAIMPWMSGISWNEAPELPLREAARHPRIQRHFADSLQVPQVTLGDRRDEDFMSQTACRYRRLSRCDLRDTLDRRKCGDDNPEDASFRSIHSLRAEW